MPHSHARMNSLQILAAAAEVVQEQERQNAVPLTKQVRGLYPPYTIRKGNYADIESLASVERSAADKYNRYGYGDLVDGNTVQPERLMSMIKENHLWVAADQYGPIGFVCGENLNGSFHLAEISVALEFQESGIGSKLMAEMVTDIIREGAFRSITLTTFRGVKWTGPWYNKFGFHEVNPKLVGGIFENILEVEEMKFKLDARYRMLMMRPLHSDIYW